MLVERYIIESAVLKAADGHSKKKEVKKMIDDKDNYITQVQHLIDSGEYKTSLCYRQLIKTNTNGKVRHIDSPVLLTRVLQHVALQLLLPKYIHHDNKNGLNCKEGYGISAKGRDKSVIRKLKHMVYDRRDLNYIVIIDQRKCYEHIRPKIFRKEAKKLGYPKDVIDYTIDVGFVNNQLPIGTPTSPTIHHIVMLSFDHWCKQNSPWSLRYADDNIFAVRTLEEANALKWRVRNYWWYELQMRAKPSIRLQPLSKEVSMCGYIVRRNSDKCICDHDKGYTSIRHNIKLRALHCRNDKSWGSYFGLLVHADAFGIMLKIQEKMKLRELTEKIRISRNMDAPNIPIRELDGQTFTLYNYDMRKDTKTGKPNWIKCLIGIDELDEDGNKTGKIKAYEFHGGYQYLVEFIDECERKYGKDAILPLEEAKITNQCGYIFVDSTNQQIYI